MKKISDVAYLFCPMIERLQKEVKKWFVTYTQTLSLKIIKN